MVPGMTNRPPPSLSKWIFVLTDVLLLIGFAWTVQHVLPPKSTWDYAVILTVAALWMVGAWICVKPWLEEFRARNQHLENETLASAVEQIQRLEEVASRIQTATSAWQSAQDSATRTATAAREIEEKIKANMKDFMEFTERVNNEEKKHMNLEIEKLRRSEADWLQVTARMLDHTFMLNQAALRSGQAGLINQLNNFQTALRETARRMGLVPFVPAVGEEFNSRAHQTETPDTEPPAGSTLVEILATGFTFQGQLLRRALVRVGGPQQEATNESQPVNEQPIEGQATEPEASPEAIQENDSPLVDGPIPSSETNNEIAPVEQVQDASPEPESVPESQPRRRARKPDPQTSLPF
jgi:molecular chaperone GrpE (heat shock protein)